jgi:hypothetical protein
MILTVSGDTEIARGYLCLIAGMDNCSRISITGNVVSFDTKDLDLSANEGAFLIDQLIHSTYVYDFSYGPKVKTAGKSKDVEFVSNIPAFPDQMENYRAKRLPAEIFPADGIDAQIALYYNPKKMAQKSRTKLKPSEPWTAAFHELAEAFSKIDGMSYYYARGHNYDAMRRERALRDQRPYLKEYNYGSGGYVDNPTQDLIIKK